MQMAALTTLAVLKERRSREAILTQQRNGAVWSVRLASKASADCGGQQGFGPLAEIACLPPRSDHDLHIAVLHIVAQG